MDQLSFFDDSPAPFPETYADVEALHKRYVYEGETDEDAFTWNEITSGRSYSFYGQKVFEFCPAKSKKAKTRLRVPSGAGLSLTSVTASDQPDIAAIFTRLKELKRKIFRNTITEVFGCCNDFTACSDARRCLHPEDRFYNGCQYRENLENGRIFYGINANQ